ncbi:MAG TPA: enoyl-CoA hydratase/isomerase family protein [Candidatus Cybelea sp.]|nr:enoyl-CoA hydratase/isomerase family protein [Candidatus Cybelea sp.]
MVQIGIEVQDRVALIRFANLPGGCMNEATVAELDAAVRRVETDDGIGAVVFTGAAPGVFIRHYSVPELERLAARIGERAMTFDPARPVPEHAFGAICRRMEEMPKATIAAINGMCMGGGFEFALACDIRIAAAGDYSIGLPEINIGLLPGAGGTQKLSRLVGPARALEMMLRGRTIKPAEALALGMVHEVTDGDALARGREIAGEIAGKSPRAVAHIKYLVRRSAELPLQDGLAAERTLFLDLLVTREAIALMHRMTGANGDIRRVEPAGTD